MVEKIFPFFPVNKNLCEKCECYECSFNPIAQDGGTCENCMNCDKKTLNKFVLECD